MGKLTKGMYAALMTGLSDDGGFDPKRQFDLTRFVLGHGLSGLYVGGSSAESGLLETEELLEQQAVVAECAAGTGQALIAHVGMPSLSHSIRLAENAAALGYSALSALPPHSYPFSDSEIFGYYEALSDATDLPMIVYEIPIRTGRPLGSDFLESLLDLPNVAGIKFTSTDLFKLSMLRKSRPDKLYFFGFDEMFLGAAALGADGGIGTTYNVFGKAFVSLWDAVQDSDLVKARQIQSIVQDLVIILMQTGIMPGLKVALRELGVECGPTRLPLALRSDDSEALLSEYLKRSDVRQLLGRA